MMRWLGVAAVMAMTGAVQVEAAGGGAAEWTVVAPGGKLAATLGLLAPQGVPGYPADKPRLYYRIQQGPEGSRQEVLPWSPLAGGTLAGRYLPGRDYPEGSRAAGSGDYFRVRI